MPWATATVLVGLGGIGLTSMAVSAEAPAADKYTCQTTLDDCLTTLAESIDTTDKAVASMQRWETIANGCQETLSGILERGDVR